MKTLTSYYNNIEESYIEELINPKHKKIYSDEDFIKFITKQK